MADASESLLVFNYQESKIPGYHATFPFLDLEHVSVDDFHDQICNVFLCSCIEEEICAGRRVFVDDRCAGHVARETAVIRFAIDREGIDRELQAVSFLDQGAGGGICLFILAN